MGLLPSVSNFLNDFAVISFHQLKCRGEEIADLRDIKDQSWFRMLIDPRHEQTFLIRNIGEPGTCKDEAR